MQETRIRQKVKGSPENLEEKENYRKYRKTRGERKL